MILLAVIAAAIGGLIAGLKLPLLLLPLIYVSTFKEKKDIFLLLFFGYTLAIGYEFEVANLYELDLITVLSVVVPSLLLLDSGLRSRLKEEKPSFAQVPFIAFVIAFVIGWFVREVFVAAVFGALIYEFSKDNARRGIFAVLIVFSLLITAIVLGQGVLNLEGSAATQVVFISAVSTLIALVFFWRKRDRVEFAPLVLVYR
ncbi:MAG TPA: hypothetical protein C5S37_10390 [Methanophagales archaeon]|nr:hypothetical protein [Methanophagales archaeon]